MSQDFDTFVRQHGNELARLAFLLSGDRGHAEDLVQSSLLKVHKAWPRVAAMEFPVAYVRTILTREFISWWRRSSSHEVVTDVTELAALRPVGDPADLVAQRDATWRHLASLTKRQRAVLVLRYYADMTDPQIAATLRCSTETVRSHAKRGLQSLRQRIDPLTEESLT